LTNLFSFFQNWTFFFVQKNKKGIQFLQPKIDFSIVSIMLRNSFSDFQFVTEKFFNKNPNFDFFKQCFGEKWKPPKFCLSADFSRTAKTAVNSKKIEKFSLTEKKWKPQKSPTFFLENMAAFLQY